MKVEGLRPWRGRPHGAWCPLCHHERAERDRTAAGRRMLKRSVRQAVRKALRREISFYFSRDP